MNLNIDKSEKRVVLGASGGVDSSVAALLLKRRGFEVFGLTFYQFDIPGLRDDYLRDLKTSGEKNIEDARNICQSIGASHYAANISKDFKRVVVDYFTSEYLRGRTPNPCALCNPAMKWRVMLDYAESVGAKYVATGHYAQIEYDKYLSRFILKKGADRRKDQSYMLWGLSQSQLSRTIFPLGDLTKKRIREFAAENFPPVAEKAESQEVCFIPGEDYKIFLKESIPNIDEKIGEGDIIKDGVCLGRHKGYPFYTIGQRKGLGVAYKEPIYVKKIDPGKNELSVAVRDEFFDSGLIAMNVNLIKYSRLCGDKEFVVKIRYKDPGERALCRVENGKLRVEFDKPRRAATPGQSVAFYEGADLVGGAVIDEAF